MTLSKCGFRARQCPKINPDQVPELGQKKYTEKSLRGLKVEHDADKFQEGKSVILTLKDADVLGQDQDTLVNVNVMDQV